MQSEKAVKKQSEKPKPTRVSKSVPKPAPVPSPNSVVSIITAAANRYGVDVDRALRIAQCESGYNSSAVNTGYFAGGGHPTGLFQYLPETWNRIAGRSPYGVGNIYSAQDQANVTMWAWANGYAGEWECN